MCFFIKKLHVIQSKRKKGQDKHIKKVERVMETKNKFRLLKNKMPNISEEAPPPFSGKQISSCRTSQRKRKSYTSKLEK